MLKPLLRKTEGREPLSILLTDPNKLKSVREFKFVIHTKNNSNKSRTTSSEDHRLVEIATKLAIHLSPTRQHRAQIMQLSPIQWTLGAESLISLAILHRESTNQIIPLE